MTDERTITFYPYFTLDVSCVFNYRESKQLMDERKSFSTTQMCMLMDPRIQDYDRIEIREPGKRPIILERKSNTWGDTWETDSTDRELRMCHNLFRLWRAGEFDE